ncbi:MAG TPA: DMT family transporter [Dongiaceae bacterium]
MTELSTAPKLASAATSDRTPQGRAGRVTQAGRATLIGIIAILLWAALALLTALAQEAGSGTALPPFELLTLSFGIACIGGVALLALRGQGAMRLLIQRPAAWFTAFIGIFLYHALYFFALSSAPPAEASLIAYLWPLLIVLFSAALPGEHLRWRHVGGAMLGLGGTALLLAKKLMAAESGVALDGNIWGYLAAFGCAFTWSGYSVLNRRFGKTPSEMIIGVCGAVAVAGGLCHLLLVKAGIEVTVVPTSIQWLAIIGLGIGPTGLAFLAWDYATKHGKLSLLGALSYLAPLLSTLLLILCGRAEASSQILAATGLIIAGAVVATEVRWGLSRHRITWRR